MKIKLSKSQWEKIGSESGWLRTADYNTYIGKIKAFTDKHMQEGKEKSITGNTSSYVLGALEGAIAGLLSDIEFALTNSSEFPSLQSTVDLGADELIKQIVQLKKQHNLGANSQLPLPKGRGL
jgi:hypothetical protein